MNKYHLNDYLKCSLLSHASTFKATSYDEDNKEHLCQDESTHNVYDFDAYVAATHPKSELPASPDAVYIGDKNLYFVEFKNQPARNINKDQIRRKFCSGTKILQSMLQGFTPRDCTYIFCVAFKSTSQPKYFDSRHFQQTSSRFELDVLNEEHGRFYDQIITEDIDFFRNKFGSSPNRVGDLSLIS